MKLYGMGKSRSMRALWALEEAHAEYDYVVIEFGSTEENGAQSEKYRCLNSQGKVPTLVDDELIITESAAILNYIANKYPSQNLVPEDITLKAKYDELCYFILSDLEQGLWTSGKHRFALPEPQRVPDVLKTASWEFNKAQQALGCLFDGKGFAIGDCFSMADILLAHTISWANNFKFEVAQRYLDYRDKMYQRPACIKAQAKAED